jgi:hypothetical protein
MRWSLWGDSEIRSILVSGAQRTSLLSATAGQVSAGGEVAAMQRQRDGGLERERGIENERKEDGVRENEGEGGMERTTEREGDREEGRESWSGPGECTSSRQKINSLHLSPSS